MSIETYWDLYRQYYGHNSVESFQRFAGLPATGQLDEDTAGVILTPRCGLSDSLRVTAEARWRRNRLRYYVDAFVDGIDQRTQHEILREAWRAWESVADVRLQQVGSAQEADIVISTGRGPRAGFDGPSGTLAWAQLPNGSDQQLLMRFDLGEKWDAGQGSGILLLNVACHEFGHLLGLDHSQVNGALMAPFYSRQISRPQSRDDIPRIQAYYGPPTAPPVVPPSPPTIPPQPSPGGSFVTREIVKAFVRGGIAAFGAYAAKTLNPFDDIAAKWAASKEDWLVDKVLSLLPPGLPLTASAVEVAFHQAVAELKAA